MESGTRSVKSGTTRIGAGGRAVSLGRGADEFSRHFIGEEAVRRFLEMVNNQVSVIEARRTKVSCLACSHDREKDDAVDRLAVDISRKRAEIGKELRKAHNAGYLGEVVMNIDGARLAEVIRAAHEEECTDMLLGTIDRAGCYSKAISSAYYGGCLDKLILSDEHLRKAIDGVVGEGSKDLLNIMAWSLGFKRMVEVSRDGNQVMMEALASLSILHNYKEE